MIEKGQAPTSRCVLSRWATAPNRSWGRGGKAVGLRMAGRPACVCSLFVCACAREHMVECRLWEGLWAQMCTTDETLVPAASTPSTGAVRARSLHPCCAPANRLPRLSNTQRAPSRLRRPAPTRNAVLQHPCDAAQPHANPRQSTQPRAQPAAMSMAHDHPPELPKERAQGLKSRTLLPTPPHPPPGACI